MTFDPTVTLGNVISIVVFLAGLGKFAHSVLVKIALLEQWTRNADKELTVLCNDVKEVKTVVDRRWKEVKD